MTLNRAKAKQIEQLVSLILDQGLTSQRRTQLEDLLNHDPEACEVYLNLVTTDGHLQRQLGGQIPEIPGLPLTPPLEPIHRKRSWRHLAAIIILGIGLLMGFGLAGWWRHHTDGALYVATLRNTIDAHWQAPRGTLALGRPLKQGVLKLSQGLAEIELFDGTALILEGPTCLDLLTPNSVHLQEGTLLATVPSQAQGFTVKTPVADVVDLGTRMGVRVDDRGTTWTRVYQGQVELSPRDITAQSQRLGQNQAAVVTPGTLMVQTIRPESLRFPEPARTYNPGVAGDFEIKDDIDVQGVPGQPGYWSGDLCEIVSAEQGITPYHGQGMLRFLGTSAPKDRPRYVTGASQQWQIIDLYDIREEVQAGYVSVEASAYFNRIASSQQDSEVQQGISIHAFKGNIDETRKLWPHRSRHRTRCLESEVRTDNDPATWERVDLTLHVPSQTDFLVIEIRTALEGPKDQEIEQFEGHYADDLSIHLRVGPTPAQ